MSPAKRRAHNEIDPYTTAADRHVQTLKRGMKNKKRALPKPTFSGIDSGDNIVLATWPLEDLLRWALCEFDRFRVLRPAGPEIGQTDEVVLQAWADGQEWRISSARELEIRAFDAVHGNGGQAAATMTLQVPALPVGDGPATEEIK